MGEIAKFPPLLFWRAFWTFPSMCGSVTIKCPISALFQFVAFFSLGMVILSTLTFVISTMEEFQGRKKRERPWQLFCSLWLTESRIFSRKTFIFYRGEKRKGNFGRTKTLLRQAMESEGGKSGWLPFISIGLNYIDTFVIVFFTLEYLIRFGRSRFLLELFVKNLPWLYAVVDGFQNLPIQLRDE